MESDVPPPSSPPPPPPALPPIIRQRPVQRPQSPEAPRPRGGATGWIILTVILVVVAGGVFVLSLLGSMVGAGPATMSSRGGHHGLIMSTIEDNSAGDDILVIELNGVITSGSMDGHGRSIVELVKEQLEIAKERKRVKAVILRVDSPGGEVMPSDDIAELITKFQKESKKPVIAQMGSVAASGGYYISAPCRWIVANKLTITGSIGVIMSGYNYRGLMDKVGVRAEVFKSGKMKDMLSSSKKEDEILPEEREIVMNMIMETYGTFTNVVSTGRSKAAELNGAEGRKLSGSWASFTDGRILTGNQAYELGFVDEIGNFETAVARAKTLAKISNANLIQFQAPFDIGSLFRIFGKTETKTLKIDLGVETLKLKKGYLYFMMPTAL